MEKVTQILSKRNTRCEALASSSPLWFADPHEMAEHTRMDMEGFGFDVAPLAPPGSFHFVTLAALKDAPAGALTAAVAQPIPATAVLGADAPLFDGIELLRERPHVFLQRRRELVGLVTRADLGCRAVSAFGFGLCMAFESGLDSLIPSYAPQSVWLDGILANDRKKILEVFESRKRFNSETTYFDAMTLRQRIAILEGLPALRRDVLTADVANLFDACGNAADSVPLTHLRNTLAHGGSILDAFPDPAEALAILERVEKLAQRVLTLVAGREQLWEAYGKTLLSWSTPSEVCLNGPDAAHDGDFVWPIFAISASNPFDRMLSDSLNAERTRRLVVAVERNARRSWVGVGSAWDGTYAEATVFAEGMDAGAALELGRHFGQRAIFRVERDAVTVVLCRDGSDVRAWPRRWEGEVGG